MLVDFGDRIDRAVNDQVIQFDAAIRTADPAGLIETVPSFASVMLHFDPAIADFSTMRAAALAAARTMQDAPLAVMNHCIPVTYGGATGPDLAAVASQLDLTTDAVIAQHLAGDYRAYMCGFAPGYAYLGGVPAALSLPRKRIVERGHPAGSVMIAAGQCIVTTVDMPTGWWVIGRTQLRIFDPTAARPFLIQPGDSVRFVRADAP